MILIIFKKQMLHIYQSTPFVRIFPTVFKIKRFVLQFNCKYMQDVHITCILILEFMRKTPAFEFNTFSICIILQTVCIICLNNSSCSFQDTKLFQFSCIDSQHRDKYHTLIFDNYEKKSVTTIISVRIGLR